MKIDPGWTVPAALAGFVFAKAAAAFFTAYGQKLGEHFAERTLLLLERAHEHEEKDALVLVVPTIPAVRFEIDHGQRLPDEAWLALLSLDLADPALRGTTLRWNPQAKSWRPTPELEPRKEAS